MLHRRKAITPPPSLTRPADEQALQDIKLRLRNWMYLYAVKHCNIGTVPTHLYVAKHYRELWAKLPEQLKHDYAEVQARLDAGSNAAATEEWLPATRAVTWANEAGFNITLKWLTCDARKHGVKTRPCQSGRHKVEVEWNSLAGCLLRPTRPEEELDEEAISARIRQTQERKRRERSLD